ncbi:hypothetical protein ONS95_014640 [Cadophora gregata]|uniref:uncharacterized protein n=1 Tax=Cadophora gregata TaxID=51156 RepID=UPI0026DD6612|nr:uncharacterized protein ONS95_014640 [Cadophora gregata]KAK0112919.1 hypothetical protein ONS95_014640 [Cadophora gregata]KAK0125044.1 hypothetical protein ONS96_008912 [Cadophora gregata f. sp. sojae]
MSTFTCFPLLAGELQLRIWELSISDKPALLPRRPMAALAACRDSRTTYLKVYTRFFKSSARSLFEYPISLYANTALDSTLFLDNESILLKNFEDWIEPGFKDTIRHLAVEDTFWRQPEPRPEQLSNDLRFKLFHANTGIEGIVVVNVVLTSADFPGEVQEQTRETEKKKLDLNDRTLAICEATYPEDPLVMESVRGVYRTLNELHQAGYFESWVEPELRMTRILYN